MLHQGTCSYTTGNSTKWVKTKETPADIYSRGGEKERRGKEKGRCEPTTVTLYQKTLPENSETDKTGGVQEC